MTTTYSFRKLFKFIFLLMTGLAALWLTLFSALQVPSVQKWIQEKILQFVNEKTEYHLEIEKVNFYFPFSIHLSNLKLSKNNETITVINDLKISLLSPTLFSGNLIFPYVEIDKLYLESFDWPQNPTQAHSPHFQIQKFQIHEIHLGSHVVDTLHLSPTFNNLLKDSSLDLQGNVSSSSTSAHIAVILTNLKNTVPPLHASFNLEDSQLTLEARLSHLPLEYLIKSPSLSSDTTCDLYWNAESDFPLKEEVKGHFKIDLNSINETGYIDALIGKEGLLEGLYSWKNSGLLEITDFNIQLNQLKGLAQATLDRSNYHISLKGQLPLLPEMESFQSEIDGSFDKEIFTGKLLLSGALSESFTPPVFSFQTDYRFTASTFMLPYLEWKGLGSTIKGHLSLAGPDWNPEFLLSSENIQWKEWQAKNITFSSNTHESSYHIQAVAKGILYQDFLLDQLDADILWNERDHIWNFSTLGHREKIFFGSTGQLLPLQNGLKVTIESLIGNLGLYPFKLNTPFSIHSYDNSLSISDLELSLGKGLLQIKGEQDLKNIQLELHAKKIEAAALEELFHDLPFEGEISFSAKLLGLIENPEATLNFDLERIRLKSPLYSHLPLIQGVGDLTLKNRMASFNATIEGIGKQSIKTSGQIPLFLNLSPLSVHLEEKPLSITVKAEGEIGPFLHLVDQDTNLITGEITTQLTLTGTHLQPELRGSAELINGTFESLSMGAIYHHIYVSLEGNRSQIFVKHLTALNEKEGKITATGVFNLIPKENFPFEIDLIPSKISILDSDYAKISASGALQLKGSLKGAKLSGSLVMDESIISIEEEKTTPIKSVEVTFINGSKDKSNPAINTKVSSSWPLELDIQAQIPNRLKIIGDHFTSDWKGFLSISGSPQSPLINGELQVSKGQFNLNGKTFAISQGNIHFGGSLEKKTFLHIVASKEISPIKAEIVLQGSTKNPALSFRSIPPLSEREVLSYILFNRGISDITTNQGSQLNQSFMTLNSSSDQGSDLLSNIRNNIGLDRLDLASGGGDTNEFSLQMGKYISKGVLIGINKGINSAANRVTLEAELRKNIKAQAELSDDGQGKILFKWKKSY
jgi:hypothetical protein